jgi:3-hydroxyacyl-CoA dehydrogenase
VDAIAASLKPFDEGLKVEGEAFLSPLAGPESRALRRAFFAERDAGKIPDLPASTPTRKVAGVAVIGAGTMGADISMNFLSTGFPVTMLEMRTEALESGVAAIRRNYEGLRRKAS